MASSYAVFVEKDGETSILNNTTSYTNNELIKQNIYYNNKEKLRIKERNIRLYNKLAEYFGNSGIEQVDTETVSFQTLLGMIDKKSKIVKKNNDIVLEHGEDKTIILSIYVRPNYKNIDKVIIETCLIVCGSFDEILEYKDNENGRELLIKYIEELRELYNYKDCPFTYCM